MSTLKPPLAPGPVKRDRRGLMRCRVCGCTVADACPGGCAWTDEDICTVCAEAAAAVAEWTFAARRVNWSAFHREVLLRVQRS